MKDACNRDQIPTKKRKHELICHICKKVIRENPVDYCGIIICEDCCEDLEGELK